MPPAKTRRANGARSTAAKTAPVDVPIVLSSDEPDPDSGREPLFTIGDKVYTIPVSVPVSDVLTFLTIAVEQGDLAALLFAMRSALGDEGFAALRAHKSLTREQLGKVTAACHAKFDGALAGPKGDSD